VEQEIAALVAGQQEGRPLERAFYADPVIFRRDLDCLVLRHWLCLGHESRVPRPGDFFLCEIAEESLIVARQADGTLRALVNVCRHRGSRICREASGSAKSFSCPYHGWTYGLDGGLQAARHMPQDFDRAGHGLHRIHLRVVEGLIFVSFAEAPLGLQAVEDNLRAALGPYGWAEAKEAHRETWPIAANWKLAVENYVECYHCAPAHPEYARLHANEHPRERVGELSAAMAARTAALGLEVPARDGWALAAPPGEEATYCGRTALLRGAVTGSADGKGVAPLMGRFRDYDGGGTFVHVGPASFFLAYPDHGLVYRFVPRTVETSEMEVIWLVRGDAREGVDYDLEKLTWLWRVTSEADKRIIEDNQRGVNSRFYRPGPLSTMESSERRFVEWYLSELRAEDLPLPLGRGPG